MYIKNVIKYAMSLVAISTLLLCASSHADIFSSPTNAEKQTDIFGNTKGDVELNNVYGASKSKLPKIPINTVMSKLSQTKGFVAIHLSAEAKDCSLCEQSNHVFEVLAERHANEMPFWRTNLEPDAENFNSAFCKNYKLAYYPVTLIFKDGILQRQMTSYRQTSEMEDLFRPLSVATLDTEKQYKLQRYTTPVVTVPHHGNAPVGVETIDQNLLSERVNTSKGIVVINFSSYDASCAECINANPHFDELAKRYEGKVTFWRSMSYPFSDTALDAPFAKQNTFNASIPMVLLFENGKVLSIYRGVTSTDALERYLFFKKTK